MTPKQKNTSLYIMMGAVLYAIVFYVLLYYNSMGFAKDASFLDNFMATFDAIMKKPFTKDVLLGFKVAGFWGSVAIMTGICGVVALWTKIEGERHQRDLPGKEDGSAKWLTNFNKFYKTRMSPAGKAVKDDYTTKDIYENGKLVREKHTDRNIILSKNSGFSTEDFNFREINNNNVIVFGAPGTGKTRGLIGPNILQMNSSYVVTDPSGEIRRNYAKCLKDHGYKIKSLDLNNFETSSCYNPFGYIDNDADVQILANVVIANTQKQGAGSGDPFWDDAAKALLQSLIYYMKDFVPKKDQNFGKLVELMLLAEVDENDSAKKSPLDELFDNVEKVDPTCMAVKQYKIFKMGAGKTLKSILISLGVRLEAFTLPEFAALTSFVKKDPNKPDCDCTDEDYVDELDLHTIGEEKTALFCVTPQANDTFDFLAAIAQCQLFETLYRDATNLYGGKLPVKVQFLLDEFANIGKIPDFDKRLTTMRKYGISCMIIFQSYAQIKEHYEKQYGSLIAGCEAFVFLGSQEYELLEYISKLLGETTINARSRGISKGQHGSSSENYNHNKRALMTPGEIRTKIAGHAIVMLNGLDPIWDRKYDVTMHKNYKYTGLADKNNRFEPDNTNTLVVAAKDKTISASLKESLDNLLAVLSEYKNVGATICLDEFQPKNGRISHPVSIGSENLLKFKELVDLADSVPESETETEKETKTKMEKGQVNGEWTQKPVST